MSPKLCSDISRFLHEWPISFINNTVMNDTILVFLALYDWEPYRKAYLAMINTA